MTWVWVALLLMGFSVAEFHVARWQGQDRAGAIEQSVVWTFAIGFLVVVLTSV